MNNTPSELNYQHKKLADMLIKVHLTKSPFTRLPTYDFSQLQKGIPCTACHSFKTVNIEMKIVCDSCGYAEDVDNGVLRNIGELQLLFPNDKITTHSVHEWCKIIKSKKTIRRILMQNLKSVGDRRHRFYIERE